MRIVLVCAICFREVNEESILGDGSDVTHKVCPFCGTSHWMYYDADNKDADLAVKIARAKLTR